MGGFPLFFSVLFFFFFFPWFSPLLFFLVCWAVIVNTEGGMTGWIGWDGMGRNGDGCERNGVSSYSLSCSFSSLVVDVRTHKMERNGTE